MKYHSLKMQEVNDTMRHLWSKTYRGTGTHAGILVTLSDVKLVSAQISTASRLVLITKVAQLNVHTITE